MEKQLSAYVPHTVMSALNAGKYSMLGELRAVTILFINLPDFKYDTPAQIADNQRAFLAIQKTLQRFDGSLRYVYIIYYIFEHTFNLCIFFQIQNDTTKITF